MGIVARLRRGLRKREEAVKAPAAALRAVGPAPAPSDAGEAELDTLRGELVRELDRLAEDDDGSGSFRRIAS